MKYPVVNSKESLFCIVMVVWLASIVGRDRGTIRIFKNAMASLEGVIP